MKNLKKLTLLHSNDMHGDFFAEKIDSKLVGGVARLSGYVNKVRAEERNVLYAIAGDMFRGSVIDSEFRGVSTIEIMNLLGPDVATIGNHEVDYGIAHLLFLEKCANFPIINANFYIRTNHRRMFESHYIAELDGMKILFIGVITQEVLAHTRMEEYIGSFIDIGEAAEEGGRICNAWGVDVIIGGHSHTLPTEPAEINDILIVQAGTGTDQIGRFDIMVDTDRNAVDSYTWRTIPINDETCPLDEEIYNFILQYKEVTDKKYNRIVTRFTQRLEHQLRTQETPLGNLAADALCESLGVDMAFMGSGAIRSKALGPVVHYADFSECFPFDEATYMIKVTGALVERMLRRFLREEAFSGAHTEFYQLSSGFEVVWSRSLQQFKKLLFNGRPLEPEKIYKLALSKYHFSNLAEFLDVTLDEVMANGGFRIVATSYREVIEEYFTTHQHMHREVEGRLVIEA